MEVEVAISTLMLAQLMRGMEVLCHFRQAAAQNVVQM
jgi:hypothetical protein